MRDDAEHVQHWRIAGDPDWGFTGAFRIHCPRTGAALNVVASDGMGWDHVSVSTENRCPRWEEMCFVKDQFFDAEECVVQFHPPQSQYINNHPYCLHLWRNHSQKVALPDQFMVGIPRDSVTTMEA